MATVFARRCFWTRVPLFALMLCALVALAGCASSAPSGTQTSTAASPALTSTPEPTPSATSTLSTGGGASGISSTSIITETGLPEGVSVEVVIDDDALPTATTASVAAELLEMSGIATLAGIAPTRTPLPIATPDAVLATVDQALDKAGLADGTFLWVGYIDWINVFYSVLIVVLAFLFGMLVTSRWALALVRKTKSSGAERVFLAVRGHIRWLVVVWVVSVATRRLPFIPTSAQTTLQDLYFLIALAILISAAWRLIALAVRRGGAIATSYGQPERMNSFVTLVAWFLYALVVVTAVTLLFNHFAINITGLALFIGIAGLGLSLAGRDLIADLIAGMTILIDQPFRIGDRVDLMDLNTVGIVREVGMRSTRIITANNRMVVVPNSLMAKNQVINYSYPDPALNDGSEIRVAYENDAALVTRVLTEAIRSVEGVQVDKPVGVFLTSFTETSIVFRLSWWVHSAADAFAIRDLVNRAALEKMQSAGIHLPYARQHVLEEQPEPAPPPPPPERPFATAPVLAEGGDAGESLL